jgi:hypothetical protein
MIQLLNEPSPESLVGELLGHNIFAYCKNNPVNMSDPTGFAARMDEGGAGTALQKEPEKPKVSDMPSLVQVTVFTGVIWYFTMNPKLALATTAASTAASNAVSEVESTAITTYYPPNDGFYGTPSKITLQPGTMIDRYGYPGGYYAAPVGTPAQMRALPPDTYSKPYNVYTVLEPIDVLAGRIAPWFGQQGGGMQYFFKESIADLIKRGALK